MDPWRLASGPLLVVCILTVVSGAAGYSSQTRLFDTETQTIENQNDFRLPPDVIPYHYEVKLKPQIYEGPQEDFNFEGSVTIFVTCKEATDIITLHMDSLDIDNSRISVKEEGSQTDLYDRHVYDEPTHFLQLYLTSTLQVESNCVVEIHSFSGNLSVGGVGLYLSYYTEGNTTVYLMASQLFPTYARKAFPCFDEPQLKATFDVILVRRTDTGRDYMSLSNAPLLNSTNINIEGDRTWVEDRFKRTPEMTVYTLGFVVCDLKSMENDTSTSPSVKIRTFAPPNEMSGAEKVHETIIKLFEGIDGYLNPDYSEALTKLDNVLVPHLDSESTENWGLVMYKAAKVLSGHKSAEEEVFARTVITYNLALQWFGNFVTLKWWKWAWLHEGFAFWMGHYMTERIFSDWNMTQWFVYKIHQAMVQDADNSKARSVEYEPQNTNDILTMLKDDTARYKGAALIRMMQFVMGEQTFIDGVNEYLTTYKYDNANSTDLFNILDKRLKDEDKAKFGDNFMSTKMASWFSLACVPVVEVNKTTSGYTLKQKSYPNDKEQCRWEIPITYATGEEPNMHKNRDDIHWLSSTDSPLEINTASDSWILVNINQTAYCHVLYDNESWNDLIRQLNTDPSSINAINRGWILHDVQTFFEDGHLELSPLLQTLDILKSEHELLPWLFFDKYIPHLEVMLETSDLYDKFVDRIKNLVQIPIKDLSLQIPDNMSATDMLIRQILAKYACKYGEDSCVAEARRIFQAWKSNGTFGSHDTLRSLFYCTAVANGNQSDWDYVLAQYNSNDISEENKPPFNTLGCSKDDGKLAEFLESCLDDLHGQPRFNTIDCMKAVASGSEVGRRAVLQFVLRNSSKLLESFENPEHIEQIVNFATQYFYNKDFTDNVLPQFEEAFKNASINSTLSSVKTRANSDWNWWEKNKMALTNWLNK